MFDEGSRGGTQWRHLGVMQFQTILTARVPRCSCETCRVKMIAVPWADNHSRFTLLVEAFAIDVLQESQSIQAAALLLGIDWLTARVIMRWNFFRGFERRSLDQVRHVGIDERRFGKGQDYVTVMTDIDQSRVLDVTPDRTIESADDLWKTLSRRQRRKVKAVCMDPENLSDQKNDEIAALRRSTLVAGRARSIKEMFRFFERENDAVGGRAFFES